MAKDNSFKAIYVGTKGEPVKVWDNENGVLDEELYKQAIEALFDKAVSDNG